MVIFVVVYSWGFGVVVFLFRLCVVRIIYIVVLWGLCVICRRVFVNRGFIRCFGWRRF